MAIDIWWWFAPCYNSPVCRYIFIDHNHIHRSQFSYFVRKKSNYVALYQSNCDWITYLDANSKRARKKKVRKSVYWRSFVWNVCVKMGRSNDRYINVINRSKGKDHCITFALWSPITEQCSIEYHFNPFLMWHFHLITLDPYA